MSWIDFDVRVDTAQKLQSPTKYIALMIMMAAVVMMAITNSAQKKKMVIKIKMMIKMEL